MIAGIRPSRVEPAARLAAEQAKHACHSLLVCVCVLVTRCLSFLCADPLLKRGVFDAGNNAREPQPVPQCGAIDA